MRSWRCVSGISDKSTRKPLCNGLGDFGPDCTSFDAKPPALSGHNFRVLARDLKPGAHFGALDVLFGEFHRPSFCENFQMAECFARWTEYRLLFSGQNVTGGQGNSDFDFI